MGKVERLYLEEIGIMMFSIPVAENEEIGIMMFSIPVAENKYLIPRGRSAGQITVIMNIFKKLFICKRYKTSAFRNG